MSFVVPYGLALQTLKLTRIHTTLLPPEIAVARRIRRKKPWAVVTAASLLLGLATSIMGYANAAGAVHEDRFGKAESDADSFKAKIGTEQENYKGATEEHTELVKEGTHLVGYIDKQHLWMELFRAINECLPRPIGAQRDEEDIVKIPRITIRSVTAERKKDLKEWFEALNESNRKYLTEDERKTGPEGPGYVIKLAGEHFYAPEDRTGGGIIFVRDTLVQNLRKQFVERPDNLFDPVAVGHIGISYPVITFNPPPSKVDWYPKGPPKNQANTGAGLPPGIPGAPGFPAAGVRTTQPAAGAKAEFKTIDRTVFTLEFVWKALPPALRGLETVNESGADPGEPGDVPPGTTPGVPTTEPGVPPAAVPGTPPPSGLPGTPPAVPGTVPTGVPGT